MKKSFLSDIPAWVLTIMTVVLSTIFLFSIGYPLEKFIIDGIHVGDWIAAVSTGILIAILCFFICRKYPNSAWYVPILSNALGIFAAFIGPNFWTTAMYKQYAVGWILSLLAVFAGARIGRRAAFNTKQ